jgi:hypothetical protein
MFWTLYLAHFIADYPLQNSWIVVEKRKWDGLLLHVLIHFLTMSALSYSGWHNVFWYLVLLTVIHYGIDMLKNLIFKLRPNWVIGPYFFDQFLHLLSIFFITWLVRINQPELLNMPFQGDWMVYATAVLLVTHIWFITERIVFYQDPKYVEKVNEHHNSRLILRLAIFALLIWSSRAIYGGVLMAASAFVFPYLDEPYARKAMMVDIGVATFCALFVLLLT